MNFTRTRPNHSLELGFSADFCLSVYWLSLMLLMNNVSKWWNTSSELIFRGLHGFLQFLPHFCNYHTFMELKCKRFSQLWEIQLETWWFRWFFSLKNRLNFQPSKWRKTPDFKIMPEGEEIVVQKSDFFISFLALHHVKKYSHVFHVSRLAWFQNQDWIKSSIKTQNQRKLAILCDEKLKRAFWIFSSVELFHSMQLATLWWFSKTVWTGITHHFSSLPVFDFPCFSGILQNLMEYITSDCHVLRLTSPDLRSDTPPPPKSRTWVYPHR